jgi:hypothetical protein
VKQDHVCPTNRNRRRNSFLGDHPSPAGYGMAGHSLVV